MHEKSRKIKGKRDFEQGYELFSLNVGASGQARGHGNLS